MKDTQGNVLPYQVTNIAPQAKDPKREGVAYGELIFQYDFAAGETSARFTVETTDTVAPVFSTKAFARHDEESLRQLFEVWDAEIDVFDNEAYIEKARSRNVLFEDILAEDVGEPDEDPETRGDD